MTIKEPLHSRPHRKTGKKPPGRPPGVPNQATAQGRKAFALLWADIGDELAGWIRTTAQTDPARAAQLAIGIAEFFVPKLSRSETKLEAGSSFAALVLRGQRIREGKRKS